MPERAKEKEMPRLRKTPGFTRGGFPMDGVGGGSVGPTPEPSWNPWTPPPGGGGVAPMPGPGATEMPGVLPVKRAIKPTPLKVGGRIFVPVADGGRREPKTKVTKRGR